MGLGIEIKRSNADCKEISANNDASTPFHAGCGLDDMLQRLE
jgi:hypothetical protein